MKALWWSCVLGLLCIFAIDCMANAITVTQTPSTLEKHLNSSVNISCFITSKEARGLSFNRHFQSKDVTKGQKVLYLNLDEGQIGKNTTAAGFKGRIHYREESRGEKGLNIILTLSKLQVDDTDLYCCHWIIVENKLKTYSSNGSIIIVKNYNAEHIPKRVPPQCNNDILDVVSVALSITSIPFVVCLLILSVFVLCKNFTKKFTPSRSVVSPPPRRPPPASPPPGFQTYFYLSTSVSSTFSQEYLH